MSIAATIQFELDIKKITKKGKFCPIFEVFFILTARLQYFTLKTQLYKIFVKFGDHPQFWICLILMVKIVKVTSHTANILSTRIEEVSTTRQSSASTTAISVSNCSASVLADDNDDLSEQCRAEEDRILLDEGKVRFFTKLAHSARAFRTRFLDLSFCCHQSTA